MKTGEEIVYIADDGSSHKTLDACCVRSVEVLLFAMSECSNTDHSLARGLRHLAANWSELNARLVLLNRECLELQAQAAKIEVEM